MLLFAALTDVNATDSELEQQVREAEQSFADAMAERDHGAFAEHVSEEAVFFNGEKAIRGKAAVLAAWSAFFEPEVAPFSWRPETVQVLDSGALAHSSGPVLDEHGKRIATFNSVWRKEPDGKWRVVFDKGCSACECRGDRTGGS